MEVFSICDERGWQVIEGADSGEPEGIADIARFLEAALAGPVVPATPGWAGLNRAHVEADKRSSDAVAQSDENANATACPCDSLEFPIMQQPTNHGRN